MALVKGPQTPVNQLCWPASVDRSFIITILFGVGLAVP